jgi:hypothetical protein
MASSSTGVTYQEREYRDDFKSVYAQFYLHGFHREAATVVSIYRDLLDQSKAELLGHIVKNQEGWAKMVSYLAVKDSAFCNDRSR